MRPTPTLSVAQRDQLLGEGVARTRLGFFVRPPSGWNADLAAEDGVALRFANTTADSDGSGHAFASLLIGFDEDAVPAPEQRSSYLANTVRDATRRDATRRNAWPPISRTSNSSGPRRWTRATR